MRSFDRPVSLALTVCLVVLGRPAPVAAQVNLATDLAIEHTPLQCVTPVKMPKVDARVLPGKNLERGYVFFRAAGTKNFYYVYLDKGPADDVSALLPRPTSDTKGIDYYLQALNRQRLQTETEQYRPQVVADEKTCREKAAGAPPAEGTSPGAKAGLVVGLTVEGQDPVPPGFNAADIASIILESGAIISIAAALQMSGSSAGAAAGAAAAKGAAASGAASGGTAGAAAGTTAAATGGGISSGVLIAGGVVLVGGGVALAAGGGGGGSSSPPASTPTPFPTATPTPFPTATPTPTPTPRPTVTPTPTPPVPGTGVLSFLLTWSSCVDLDLVVQEPSGEQITYQHKTSLTGGQLDIDSNAFCNQCRIPAQENIFWQTAAPRGSYQFWVGNAPSNGCAQYSNLTPTFTLQVLRAGVVVQTYTGSIIYGYRTGSYSYTY